MTDELEMCDVAKETIEILKYFDTEFTSKISNNFLNQLRELAKKSKKDVVIDKTVELKNQKVSNECKDLISMLYYQYIANEEEKKKIIDIWSSNDVLYQKR